MKKIYLETVANRDYIKENIQKMEEEIIEINNNQHENNLYKI
jgi:hypothetical protein